MSIPPRAGVADQSAGALSVAPIWSSLPSTEVVKLSGPDLCFTLMIAALGSILREQSSAMFRGSSRSTMLRASRPATSTSIATATSPLPPRDLKLGV